MENKEEDLKTLLTEFARASNGSINQKELEEMYSEFDIEVPQKVALGNATKSQEEIKTNGNHYLDKKQFDDKIKFLEDKINQFLAQAQKDDVSMQLQKVMHLLDTIRKEHDDLVTSSIKIKNTLQELESKHTTNKQNDLHAGNEINTLKSKLDRVVENVNHNGLLLKKQTEAQFILQKRIEELHKQIGKETKKEKKKLNPFLLLLVFLNLFLLSFLLFQYFIKAPKTSTADLKILTPLESQKIIENLQAQSSPVFGDAFQLQENNIMQEDSIPNQENKLTIIEKRPVKVVESKTKNIKENPSNKQNKIPTASSTIIKENTDSKDDVFFGE